MNRSVHVLSGLLIALAACGDDGTTAATDAGTDAPQIPDAPPDAPPVKPEGQVVIMEGRFPAPLSIAVATFVNGAILPSLGTVNGCTLHGSDPTASLDAGSITIAGATTPLTLVRDTAADIYMTADEPPEDLFAPAAQLTVTATGATIPAFTGSVTAPAPLAGVVFPTAISRAAPPTITWTAGTANEVWIFMIAYVGANTGTVMVCRTTDTGSFGITPAAFAQLPVAASEAVISVYRLNKTVVNAGAWEVSLLAIDAIRDDEVPIGP